MIHDNGDIPFTDNP